jgi:hypothetical protein
MEYTKYIAGMFKRSGVPKMRYEQFARLMNIIHQESKIAGIRSVQSKLKGAEYVEYGRMIFSAENELQKLTNKKKPEELLKEVLRLSSFDVEGPWTE